MINKDYMLDLIENYQHSFSNLYLDLKTADPEKELQSLSQDFILKLVDNFHEDVLDIQYDDEFLNDCKNQGLRFILITKINKIKTVIEATNYLNNYMTGIEIMKGKIEKVVVIKKATGFLNN